MAPPNAVLTATLGGRLKEANESTQGDSIMGREDDLDVEREERGRRESDRWHIGKEIPLSLLVVLISQTAFGVWFMAQLSAKIDSALIQLQEFRTDRYTKDDGRRDRELIQTMLDNIRARSSEQERRLTNIVSGILTRR